jgi:hypothetical protein
LDTPDFEYIVSNEGTINPRYYVHLVERILLLGEGLVCTNELYSYAGGSIAAGRATNAGQVSREVPD